MIAIVLAALMLMSLVAGMIPFAAHADELDDLRAKKEELSQQVKDIRAKLDGLQEEQSTVLEKKAALEEENELTLKQLEIVKEEIAQYERIIRTKAAEVDAAKNRESVQLERYRTRIRAMEENGGYNVLALVFQASNFSELLAAFDDMGEIMASDKQLQKQYEAAREETEEIKERFEAEKALYEDKQADLRREQDELSRQIEESEQLLEELSEEIEKAVAAYEAAEAAEAAAAATIANVVAQRNAIKAAAEAQVQQMTQANAEAEAAGMEAVYTQEEIQQVAQSADVGYVAGDEGGYIWPLPCSTRVTSRFGNRADPFTGETRYHSGIDIDGFGNDGAPVVAAASGEVITASYDSAYGNYIIIDHGSTSTVYAHLSGLAVSYGDTVTQGQTIGYVGATGRATGTHLHFEVYVGDSRVDPAQYFSGISYYNC